MKRKILSLLLLCFVLAQAYSQSFISQEIRGKRGVSNQFTDLDDDQLVNFNAAQVKSLLGLNQNSDLVLKRTEQDKYGFIYYRYYQTYRSIPIENSMYIIHTKNGTLKSLGGSIVIDFDQTMDRRAAQRISGEQAISIAVKHVNAKQYAWQDAGMEQGLKDQTKDPKASYKPTASLVWYSSTNELEPRNLRLSYKVDVYARQPLSRAYYFVDALTGNVIGKKDRIQESDATGTAATAYSGSQTIHSELFGGSYRLRDYTKGSGVVTRHGESTTFGQDYTSASANWSLAGSDIAALDAHYGVSQTYAFYMNVLGRNSYDNLGTTLYSYVNESGFDNAYWDGSQMHFLKFSGGSGGVTAIDITGHELTHGVTQESSGLTYQNESGAMNESMSDIFGKAVQFWSKPADNSWLLSNDMGWIIRNMANPNVGVPPGYEQPDTYHGTYWYYGTDDHGGVHTNSGVGNFMFYLLVTGGTGTNDNADPYSVSGIGLAKAEAILYRTNTVYLTPTSQYADWRVACINAASFLYGAGSNEVAQVQNAWHAVGIGDGAGGGVCNVPTGLSASSISSTSATVSWVAATGALKYNLKYQVAGTTTWATVKNIVGTTYNITGLTPNTIYKFKVQSVCSGTAKSAFSTVKKFTTKAAGTFCSIDGDTYYEYIKTVKCNTISNTSGNNGGYGDYTALSGNVTAGTVQQIHVTPGYTSSTWTEYWQVYVDYNQDADFADPGELVAQTVNPAKPTSTLNMSFTIPLTAKNGNTRMRVVMNYGAYLDNPCSTSFYGEAEDYTLKISGGAFNAVASESDIKATLNSIMVSPNPVKGGSANLILQAGKAAPVNIKVTDLSGRVLRSETINSITAGKNNYSLRNINLLPGTYMIIAQQGNAVIARTQFIVDK